MARGTDGYGPNSNKSKGESQWYSGIEDVASKVQTKKISKEGSSLESNEEGKIIIKTNVFDNVMKKESKVLKGFYLEPEVAKAIERIARKKGTRGASSYFVNTVLKDVLKASGYLK